MGNEVEVEVEVGVEVDKSPSILSVYDEGNYIIINFDSSLLHLNYKDAMFVYEELRDYLT